MLEQLRQQAIKMCKEAMIIVFAVIMLLLFLSVLFTWLEWRGKTIKGLNITKLRYLVEVMQ